VQASAGIQVNIQKFDFFMNGFQVEIPYDEFHLRSYDEEKRLAGLLISFCPLAVFVSCLGISCLAAHSTEQGTKEIVIRKVFGSSAAGIVMIFTAKYLRWMIAANIFAWPDAYFAANKRPQGFVFRISISLMPFFIAVMMTPGFVSISVIF
jgi:putative ABC transport system permease protein